MQTMQKDDIMLFVDDAKNNIMSKIPNANSTYLKMKNCNSCILTENKHWKLAICHSEQKQNQWVIDLFISE